MIIYTIGFTKKSAQDFFEALRKTGARHLLDIRLHNTSQLAGFTKRNDLRFFLDEVVGMEYHEVPALAPGEEALKEYRKTGDWPKFEERYAEVVQQRRAEREIAPTWFEEGMVLLCSEARPDRCHRRLAAEYLQRQLYPDAEISHL
ncbi:MAG: DUF488 domain-containing protein [Dehalococcoidia bacterium]|nr:DUF488 domain-containing protein [Dehalococcoidia bacterium]